MTIDRWQLSDTARWLRGPEATDHKYTRGVLGVRTGSPEYPGAAVLGVTAAWRTGIGMVRFVPGEGTRAPEFGLPSAAAAVLAARPETVFGDGRCEAWLIGSGTDPSTRSFAEHEALSRILRGPNPVVVDAGAIELAAEVAAAGAQTPAILTPHLREFERLWRSAGLGSLPAGWDAKPGEPPVNLRTEAVARLSGELGISVLLKGSTTVAVSPWSEPVLIGPATPWLATAGTGDVLAGILAALVAAHASEVPANPALLATLGAAAASLHDAAARHAAGSGQPITALDVAQAIPRAVAGCIAPGADR